MRLRSLLPAMLAFAFSSALAQSSADAIEILHAWVRLPPPGTAVTGAFMTLKNASSKDAQLTRAESSAAKITELHNHIHEGGVMKMRQVPAIAINAGSETQLKPGSFHVMLIDLKSPLKEGEKVTISLGFDDGSSKRIEAPVVRPGSENAAHAH